MSSRNLILVSVLFLVIPSLALSQVKKDQKVDIARELAYPTKIQSVFGLLGLDPNKFSMSHSYTFSFTSIGGKSLGQGLYLNTMKYQLSNPITMYLQIGFLNQPFGSLRQNSGFENKLFLSGAGFEYKPSENFKLQFEFSQTPGSLYSPYYRSSLYHQSPWWEHNKKEEK